MQLFKLVMGVPSLLAQRGMTKVFFFAEAARQPLSCVVVSRLNEFLGVTGQWLAQLDYISVSGRDSPIRGDFQLWGPQANSTR